MLFEGNYKKCVAHSAKGWFLNLRQRKDLIGNK